MTKNQKVKYFDKTDPEQKNRNEIEQINDFLASESINAIGITTDQLGIILLYEEK